MQKPYLFLFLTSFFFYCCFLNNETDKLKQIKLNVNIRKVKSHYKLYIKIITLSNQRYKIIENLQSRIWFKKKKMDLKWIIIDEILLNFIFFPWLIDLILPLYAWFDFLTYFFYIIDWIVTISKSWLTQNLISLNSFI